MAITETTPTQLGTGGATATTGLAVPEPSGVAGVIGSGDHKTLGRLYLGCSLALGALSLALLAWFDLEGLKDALSQTDRAFLNLTLGQTGLVFLFVLPLFVGLATLVVPLQVGAATIAFPRAAAAAFWTWALSAVLFLVSYLPGLGGGVGGTKPDGIGLTYLALVGLVGSLLLGTVCVMTTVVTLRPAGMSLDRVPLFAWSMLVAGGLWLLTLPALVANALVIFVDQKYPATPTLFAATDTQWTQLSWFTAPPQVFVYAIPLLGILGDAVATFTGVRLRHRGVVLVGIGAFAALGFGAYAQPYFIPTTYHLWPYVGQCVLVALPALLVVSAYGASAQRGRLRLGSPLVLAVAGLLLVLLGALASIVFIAGPLGAQTTNARLLTDVPALKWPTLGTPLFVWGVFGLVVLGAAAGGIAGLFHWSAKVTGRQLPDGLGKLVGLLVLVGALVYSGPLLLLGLANKIEGLAGSAKPMLTISLAGALLTALAVVAALALLLATRLNVIGGGATSPDDAWGGGQTLEWATASPPAAGNFGSLPTVGSPEPLLDTADGGAR